MYPQWKLKQDDAIPKDRSGRPARQRISLPKLRGLQFEASSSNSPSAKASNDNNPMFRSWQAVSFVVYVVYMCCMSICIELMIDDTLSDCVLQCSWDWSRVRAGMNNMWLQSMWMVWVIDEICGRVLSLLTSSKKNSGTLSLSVLLLLLSVRLISQYR